jgi:serine phosphatase RsbU (regulator of sigma subunit)
VPPLGVGYDRPPVGAEFSLEPGALVLFYTDGLIERHETRLDDELERLRRTLAAAPADAERCIGHVLEEFEAARQPDDVAILAMAIS